VWVEALLRRRGSTRLRAVVDLISAYRNSFEDIWSSEIIDPLTASRNDLAVVSNNFSPMRVRRMAMPLVTRIGGLTPDSGSDKLATPLVVRPD